MSDCPNCDGRVCMDCVTRTVHDDCGDSPCPVCSAVDRVDALYADEHARLRAENERLRTELERTRQAWVNGDDPMCEDVCMLACKGPCGVGQERP